MPKAKSLISKKFVKWFLKVVWPWIVEIIWPLLEEKIIELFKKVSATFEIKVSEWLENRNILKADAAQKKAEEASARSISASNDAEADKQRAIAEVWHQVAEQFRLENEVLRVELNEVTRNSSSDFINGLDSLGVQNLLMEGEDGALRLQGSQTVLRLPSPPSMKD